MSDVFNELQKFEAHCLETNQLEVAELAHNAADEIASLREKLERAREGFQKIATGRITGASRHNADASRIRAGIAKEALRELYGGDNEWRPLGKKWRRDMETANVWGPDDKNQNNNFQSGYMFAKRECINDLYNYFESEGGGDVS